jgi:hypothetical protein
MMTGVLISSLRELGWHISLVDRRFSREVGDIGKRSPGKLLAAVSLTTRLAWSLLTVRPDVCIFFVTNRSGSFLVDCVLGTLLNVARVPSVNYVHTVGFRELASRGPLWSSLTRRLLSGAVATVCLGERVSEDVASWTRPDSIRLIANTPPSNPPRISPTRVRLSSRWSG